MGEGREGHEEEGEGNGRGGREGRQGRERGREREGERMGKGEKKGRIGRKVRGERKGKGHSNPLKKVWATSLLRVIESYQVNGLFFTKTLQKTCFIPGASIKSIPIQSPADNSSTV